MAARPGQSYMDMALAEARDAAARGEVPVGAVIVGADGRVLASAGNRMRELADPTAHAEMIALRGACAAEGAIRLEGADLYVTLEPCAMCAGAIALTRIRRLYFAAGDPKGGGVEHGARVFSHPTCNHRPDVYGGLGAAAAGDMLKAFFRERRTGAAEEER